MGSRNVDRQVRMSSLVVQPYGKRCVMALLLVSVLAVLFWTQSRYPSLNEKAMMSGAIQLEDPISFEAALPVLPEYPLWKKILYSTINWIKTNRQGMTFGVLFGAAFLTLLGYLRRHSLRSGFANSALGLAMGAPLGVCVNCAAPIAKGLYSGGARAEATLSAMLASPTLNVVVLTMLFSLLPVYMAVTKIALSLAMILIAVPVICRFLPVEQLQAAKPVTALCPAPAATAPAEPESLGKAVVQFARDYGASLWFIVRTTVPLMLLAGLLGALIATLLPADLLDGAGFGIAGVTLVALVGTILPLPIGLDVVASAALLGGGLQAGYVMVLLFTLGIFSIYSFFIVAGAISLRAATLLGVVVIALGIVAGLGAHHYQQWQSRRALELLTSFDLSLIGSAQAQAAEPFRVVADGEHTILVHRRPFIARSEPAGDRPFTRMEARHLGIDKPLEFSFADMWPPFWDGRSVSAGDIDDDGDVDLALASTERGLYLYSNDGSGQFSRMEFPIGTIRDLPVFNAALVDIDNDGWLDLFLTTFRAGNFILRNEAGRFDAANLSEVTNREDAVLSMALAFGDVDRDGDLDLALGNWAAGWYRRIPGEEARNRLIFNEGGALTGGIYRDIPGLPGETLTLLLADIDMDGDLDWLEGNDFEQPDLYFLADGSGGFTPITRQDGIVPFTTTTTMAIKAADLHNDGVPEIYVAQIAGRSSGVAGLKLRSLDSYCSDIERQAERDACQTNIDIKSWYKSGHSFDPTYARRCLEFSGRYQSECKAMLVKDLAIQNRDPAICELIPAGQPRAQQLCDIHFRPIRQPTAAELAESIPQILRRNVLFVRKDDGTYDERAVEQGLEVGGWSWDVKIADVDNDEWQDVYIVNGTWVPNEVTPSNLFYRNRGDGTFSEQSGPFGLEDYLITAAATQLDIDNDGDLDFITTTVNGPVMAFVNNSADGHSIAFEFRDHIANRFGIGTKVRIRYGEGGERLQTRELQLGGGFMSFDVPVAHFGLGEHEGIDSVTIEWSNGRTTEIAGGLPAGALYRIERQPAATR
jgi:uncharacterized membrane protein YraQ (UPF0718 family)